MQVSKKLITFISAFLIFSSQTFAANSTMSFTPDGAYFAVAGKNGLITMWKSKSGELAKSFRDANSRNGKSHSGSIYAVAFSSDGKFLASAGSDKLIKIWKVEDGSSAFSFSYGKAAVNSLKFNSAGTRIYAETSDGFTITFSTESGEQLESKASENLDPAQLEENETKVTCTEKSPSGNLLATSNAGGLINLYKKDGTLLQSIENMSGKVTGLKFRPGENQIMVGTSEGYVVLYDVKTGAIRNILQGLDESVTSMAFSGGGRYLLCGGNSGKFSVLDLTSGETVVTVKQPKAEKPSSSSGSEAENTEIPGRSGNSWLAAGIFFRQEFPSGIEKNYASAKTGGGIVFEWKTQSPAGVSVSIDGFAGSPGSSKVSSWSVFTMDAGIFTSFSVNSLISLQPEIHAGITVTNAVIDTGVNSGSISFTDTYLQPAAAVRWNLPASFVLDTAVSLRCTFEKDGTLVAPGYRIGCVYKFHEN